MAPVKQRDTSDHPILEFFVLSTIQIHVIKFEGIQVCATGNIHWF